MHALTNHNRGGFAHARHSPESGKCALAYRHSLLISELHIEASKNGVGNDYVHDFSSCPAVETGEEWETRQTPLKRERHACPSVAIVGRSPTSAENGRLGDTAFVPLQKFFSTNQIAASKCLFA